MISLFNRSNGDQVETYEQTRRKDFNIEKKKHISPSMQKVHKSKKDLNLKHKSRILSHIESLDHWLHTHQITGEDMLVRKTYLELLVIASVKKKKQLNYFD